jgi:hypothetical protein
LCKFLAPPTLLPPPHLGAGDRNSSAVRGAGGRAVIIIIQGREISVRGERHVQRVTPGRAGEGGDGEEEMVKRR